MIVVAAKVAATLTRPMLKSRRNRNKDYEVKEFCGIYGPAAPPSLPFGGNTTILMLLLLRLTLASLDKCRYKAILQ